MPFTRCCLEVGTEIEATDPDPEPLDAFRPRIEAAMIKAARDAKIRTTWSTPDEEYEAAILAFIRRVLDASITAGPENDGSGRTRHLSRRRTVGPQHGGSR
jgi:maltooligosyltrehalose synthase